MKLTERQTRELRWFTENCTGVRTDFNDLLMRFIAFKTKLDRLSKTARLVEKYFEKHGKPNISTDKSDVLGTTAGEVERVRS